MPNLALALKAEIARLSKKSVKEQVSPLKAASVRSRQQIAALRQQVEQLERELKRLRSSVNGRRVPTKGRDEDAKHRFVAKGLRSLRARLGLSADDFGKLVNVSGQTVYLWEHERTRPRQQQVAAIAALRSIGKREARERLGEQGTRK